MTLSPPPRRPDTYAARPVHGQRSVRQYIVTSSTGSLDRVREGYEEVSSSWWSVRAGHRPRRKESEGMKKYSPPFMVTACTIAGTSWPSAVPHTRGQVAGGDRLAR